VAIYFFLPLFPPACTRKPRRRYSEHRRGAAASPPRGAIARSDRPRSTAPSPDLPHHLLPSSASHLPCHGVASGLGARCAAPGTAGCPRRLALLPTGVMGLLDQGTVASPSLARVDLPARRGSPPQLPTMLPPVDDPAPALRPCSSARMALLRYAACPARRPPPRRGVLLWREEHRRG
jgi:hypothetical protein